MLRHMHVSNATRETIECLNDLAGYTVADSETFEATPVDRKVSERVRQLYSSMPGAQEISPQRACDALLGKPCCGYLCF